MCSAYRSNNELSGTGCNVTLAGYRIRLARFNAAYLSRVRKHLRELKLLVCRFGRPKRSKTLCIHRTISVSRSSRMHRVTVRWYEKLSHQGQVKNVKIPRARVLWTETLNLRQIWSLTYLDRYDSPWHCAFHWPLPVLRWHLATRIILEFQTVSVYYSTGHSENKSDAS